ncbi:MAG: prephenate dehydrogenase [Gemmatimonadaceae bacterium]|nr:prephenate dehydrogenase [Gemmatimonadaceae bacterium]
MKLPSVTVVGLGCIGGSLATAITPNGGGFVTGWSTSPEDRAMARAANIDVPDVELIQSMSDARLVIIAVPVQAIAEVAAVAMRAAPDDAAIIHCGGVQSRAALGLDEPTYARVIGAHPLAGSHDSGFGASRAELFAGSTVSIESRASAHVRGWMDWLWAQVGAARLDYRSAEEHDAMMAWISHLPQLASTALAATFAAEHIDPGSVGPGARDTTRLAASAFEQWSSLVTAQPEVLDGALTKLERSVAELREALSHDDQRALRKIWDAAREWRRGAEPSA